MIVKQRQIRICRLDKGMALGQSDVREQCVRGQAGQHDVAHLRAADRQRQVLLAQLLPAACIMDEIDAAQIASSQRTSSIGGGLPGRSCMTLRTSR